MARSYDCYFKKGIEELQPSFPSPPYSSGIDLLAWPWHDMKEVSPDLMPNGEAWPRITVITPSYNQGEYIEQTIRSVLLQGYPNLEYMIMDAGSADQTVEVIKKYEPWITYWVSESDNGQSHAINKGFQRATGDLIVWLNSDDLFTANALHDAALAYQGISSGSSSKVIILGNVVNFFGGSDQEILIQQKHITLNNFIGMPEEGFSWHQPGTFVSKACLQCDGDLDESLHYAFDWDWMCKMLLHQPKIHYLANPVSRFRVHDESKTGGNMPACWKETVQVIKRYHHNLSQREQREVLAFYSVRMASLYFSSQPNYEKYWDRKAGVKALCSAIKHDLTIIKNKIFIQLFTRALLPKVLYRNK